MEQFAAFVDSTGLVTNVIVVGDEVIPDTIPAPAGMHPCIGWNYDGANFLSPTESPEQLLAAFQQSAQTALSATDTTFARIQEAITLGLTTAADPSVIAWIEYRKALRAEVRATVVGTLATKPATYPAGT